MLFKPNSLWNFVATAREDRYTNWIKKSEKTIESHIQDIHDANNVKEVEFYTNKSSLIYQLVNMFASV